MKLYPLILSTSISPGTLPKSTADSGAVHTVLFIVFDVIAALALLMIVVSGLRYVISSGDPQKTVKARNGIIYALVGLSVAIAAQAILAFVAGSL